MRASRRAAVSAASRSSSTSAGGDLAVVLVIDLVLEAGPEVHGDGAELHLDRHVLRPAGEEHRDLDDRVEALVAVGLGLGDVVLDLDHGDVGLIAEHAEDRVDVGHEAAGDPDPGDVLDRGADAVERGLGVAAAHLRRGCSPGS